MNGNDLINTKHLPTGFTSYANIGRESRAYYDLTPYPYFGFQAWKLEELGPYPRCHPIPKAIIRRFSSWLFGKSISFAFIKDKTLDAEMHKFWHANRMDRRLLAMAKKCGQEGGAVLKFSYDETNKEIPLSIQILSPVDDCRLYWNPHNSQELLMARVQYPFYKADTGEWFWFREEWTKDFWVTYESVKIDNYGLNVNNPYLMTGAPLFPDIDTGVTWNITKKEVNKFGLIPIVLIKNLDESSVYGTGDLFGMTRIIDRIMLAYHLMDRGNQLMIDPVTLFIDLEPKKGDSMDRPVQPGASMDLKSIESEDVSIKQGKAQLLESNGAMMEHLRHYADEVKQMLFDATGSVFPRQEQFTNKGSMTQSVLMQMYAPMLEVIEEKRRNYGEDGIMVFLKKIAIAMKNLGVTPFSSLPIKNDLEDESLLISLTWFTQFEKTEDEKFAQFDRYDREITGGYIPTEVGVAKINELEEIILTEEQLQNQVSVSEERFELGMQQDQGTGNDPGGSEDGQQTSTGPGNKRQQNRGKRVKDAT